MGFLSDKELKAAIAKKNLIPELAGGEASRQIKGASIDLTIGEIFQPGAKKDEPGSVTVPRSEFELKHGQTVVVRTAERLKIDQEHAGIAFPGAAESLKGLLMTNPGHVDPGYDGKLHVTLINMGQKSILLKKDARLMRCLFFKLTPAAETTYPTRPDPITQELLDQLSPDFMNVEKRAKAVAAEEIRSAEFRVKWMQIIVPVLATLFISALGIWATIWSTTHAFEQRIMRMEIASPNSADIATRLSKVEMIVPLQQRLDKLDDTTIRELDLRIKSLEAKGKK